MLLSAAGVELPTRSKRVALIPHARQILELVEVRYHFHVIWHVLGHGGSVYLRAPLLYRSMWG